MLQHSLAKPVFFFCCLSPLLWIIGCAIFGKLGANPVEAVTHYTGIWALRLLLLTLLFTPLKELTGIVAILRFRRMSGLFVYFYVCTHFMIWFLADHGLDIGLMLKDVVKRPYITVGFLAFLLLTPLALTSNKKMIKRMGKHWKTLHRLVYLILVLALLHFIWLVKADYLEPLIYTVIACVLLAPRMTKAMIRVQ